MFEREKNMTYLLLAILSSSLIAIFMRLGDKHIKNNMVMFMANYAVCMGISMFYMKSINPFVSATGIGFTAFVGIFSGIMYLVNFVLLQFNINKNGVVLASTFMKLGVLVPTIMAIVAFHETPGVKQIAGIVVAVLAILVINLDKSDNAGENGKGSAKIWLVVLLLMGGLTDSLANIYEKNGNPELKDQYLFYTFGAALLLSVVMAFIKKQHVTLKDLGFGVIIGIPNYFSARFLLLALGNLDAIVVYPVYNVATILVVSTVGVVAFKEKLNLRKCLGILCIILALVLLNI